MRNEGTSRRGVPSQGSGSIVCIPALPLQIFQFGGKSGMAANSSFAVAGRGGWAGVLIAMDHLRGANKVVSTLG